MTYPGRYARRTGRQEPRATASVMRFAARALKRTTVGVAMLAGLVIVSLAGIWLLGAIIYALTGFEG